jgi:hypothetical protein
MDYIIISSTGRPLLGFLTVCLSDFSLLLIWRLDLKSVSDKIGVQEDHRAHAWQAHKPGHDETASFGS